MRNALREGGRTDGRQNRYGDIDTAMSDHGGKRQDTHSVTRPPAGSPELEREAVRPGRRKQANPGGKRPRCEKRGLRGFAGVLAENYVCASVSRDDTWSQKLPATGCASRPIRGGAGGADARVAPGGAASGFPSQLCFQKTASSLRRAAAEAWTPSQTGSKSRAGQPSAVWPGFYRLPGESGLQPEFRATAGERAPSCDGRRHQLVPCTAPQSWPEHHPQQAPRVCRKCHLPGLTPEPPSPASGASTQQGLLRQLPGRWQRAGAGAPPSHAGPPPCVPTLHGPECFWAPTHPSLHAHASS